MKGLFRYLLVALFALAVCRTAESGSLLSSVSGEKARSEHGDLSAADAGAFLAENSRILLLTVRDSRPEIVPPRPDLRPGPSFGQGSHEGANAERATALGSRRRTLEKARQRVLDDRQARLSDAGYYLYDLRKLLI